ncbi:MAG: SGNH/GDSL hydrolase family protein [Acidobacteria bacterium]|nr:SGNH/GDSL hydrolase family protein [Acidobacteriota bacterium]
MSSGPRLARSVVVPVLISVVLLASLEGGCRVVRRLREGTWPVTRAVSYARFVEDIGRAYQPHPFLVASGRPNARLEKVGKVIQFNSLGYRGGPVDLPKPAGRFRILCAGGSTTFDLLATNNDTTWPARLAQVLRARTGRDVDVVNAGFPGWTSVESLVSLELRDIDLAPDLVIVFSGINETQPAGHEPFTPDYSQGHGELLPRILGLHPVPLRTASRFVFIEWLLDRAGKPSTKPEGFAPAWAWNGGARKNDIPPEAVAAFVRNLRSTAAVASANGAATLFVAQTALRRKGQETYDDEYIESWAPGLTAAGYRRAVERYNEGAEGLAKAGLASFVNPFDSGFEDADFNDPVHFSDAGSAKMAERIADAVVQNTSWSANR